MSRLSSGHYVFEAINTDGVAVARQQSQNPFGVYTVNNRKNEPNFGRNLLSRRLPPPIAGAMFFVSFVVLISKWKNYNNRFVA